MTNKDFIGLLGIYKDKLYSGPKIANIYINTNCNINCIYCWFHSPLVKNRPERMEISYDKFIEIVTECREMGVEYLVISSNGEPSLHPYLDKMIAYVKDNNISLRVTTNATFEKRLWQSFSRVDYVAINLSAPDSKSYKEIHCPISKNMFDRVIKNIYFLSRVNKRRGKPNIQIRYIITKNNYQCIEDIITLGIEIGIDEIYFIFMDTTEDTQRLSLSQNQYLELKNKLAILLNKGIKIQSNLTDIYTALNSYDNSIYKFPACYAGWQRISIEINGDVSLCCHNDNLIIGNVYNDSLTNIWKSDRAHKMRLKGKYSFNLEDGLWKSCKYCYAARMNKDIYETIKTKFPAPRVIA